MIQLRKGNKCIMSFLGVRISLLPFTLMDICIILNLYLLLSIIIAKPVDSIVSDPRSSSMSRTPTLILNHLDSLLTGSDFRGGGMRSSFKNKIDKISSSIHYLATPMEEEVEEEWTSSSDDDEYFFSKSGMKENTRLQFNKKFIDRFEPISDESVGSNKTYYNDNGMDFEANNELEMYQNEIKMKSNEEQYGQSQYNTSDNDESLSFTTKIPTDSKDSHSRESQNYGEDDLYNSEINNKETEISNSNHNTTRADNQLRRPVVYRYFGRSRTKPGSVPLILLGPCADHWKETSNVLASRGYSVMACEEVIETEDQLISNDHVNRDGDGLVLAILEALRWKRAVVVGCDKNSRAAIEAAMKLAPDRVAGLILFGDLSATAELMNEIKTKDKSTEIETIDDFLQEYISCPYTIICDGGVNNMENRFGIQDERTVPRNTLATLRTPILGGGLSPHRRLPEQFAWVLYRFIEESVSTHDNKYASIISSTRETRVPRNEAMERIFSPGSLLVTGRAVASAIMYLSAANVFLHQYKNIQYGLSGLRMQCQQMTVWQKQGIDFVIKVIINDLSKKYNFLRTIALSFKSSKRKKQNQDNLKNNSSNSLDCLENESKPEAGEHDHGPTEEEHNDFFRFFGSDYITS